MEAGGGSESEGCRRPLFQGGQRALSKQWGSTGERSQGRSMLKDMNCQYRVEFAVRNT